jgi:hypothetical protein
MKRSCLSRGFNVFKKSRNFRRTHFIQLLLIVLLTLALTMSGQAADRLIIKDDAGATKLKITDQGQVAIGVENPQGKIDVGGGRLTINGADTTGAIPPGLSQGTPGRLDIGYGGSGGGNLEVYGKGHATRPGEFRFVYGGGDYGATYFFQYNGTNFRQVMNLDKDRNLNMWNGAYSNGAAWLTGSSRELKEDIKELTTEQAFETFRNLKPVTFKYKKDAEDSWVGFIAEDVPEMVATQDRKSLSTMDFVGVLTKVVQEQQKTIEELTKRISVLEKQ